LTRSEAENASATSAGAGEAGFAAWALGGPLSALLGLIALVQLGSWWPHYLTWPYWADHDVFATAARAWDLGERPYRDTRLNNLPGTIYLFYGLGKLAGWGRPAGLYAFDGGLLATFVAALVAWSRRRFGSFVPGWVGSLAFLSYYLGLDYSHAAQRDWHAPCLVLLALLLAQGWPGRASFVLSALLSALGLATRPQVVLFLPAVILAIGDGTQPAATASRRMRRGVTWLALFGGLVALAFAPLALSGVMGDFLRSLRMVSYGSKYNRVGPATLAKAWFVQAAAFRWLVVPAGVVLLGRRGGTSTSEWRTARAWLLALAGASLYKPISPMAHTYLDLPLVLAWSVNLSVLAALVTSATATPAPFRLAAVLGLLGMGATTVRPEFCVVGPNVRAAAVLRSGVEPEAEPPGYRHGSVRTSAYYPWADYRDALGYLRAHTATTTRVANALKGDPAIASEVGRPSAFPAESIAWLRMVNPADEGAFVEALGRVGDSVVVWSPGEPGPDPLFRVDRLEAEIRRLYAFGVRFGIIEIWRRRPETFKP